LETSGNKYLSIHGLSIRYWAAGDLDSIPSQRVENHRLVVVFFHGFSFSLDDWKKTGTLASVSSSGYQVLAVDLPRGKASKSDKLSYADVKRYVPIIESVFTKLNVGTRSGRSIVIRSYAVGRKAFGLDSFSLLFVPHDEPSEMP
jgi:pimeloyl-ACP methyl ester carboxylesterase